MRNTKTLSVSMTPEQLKATEALAKKENRTLSELIREALRRYQQQQEWQEITAYGQAKAKAAGLTEKDVMRLIKESRREERDKRSIKQPVR